MTKYSMDLTENSLREILTEPKTTGKTIDVEREKVIIKCLKMVREDSYSPLIQCVQSLHYLLPYLFVLCTDIPYFAKISC